MLRVGDLVCIYYSVCFFFFLIVRRVCSIFVTCTFYTFPVNSGLLKFITESQFDWNVSSDIAEIKNRIWFSVSVLGIHFRKQQVEL